MTLPFPAPRTLARKIIAVIVVTTLAATLTLIPAIFFTVRQGMQGQRQRQLAGVRSLVERLIEENRRQVRNYAALFATDRQIKDNLYYYAELAGEREHPATAVGHLVAAFGLAHIELTDRFGRVVVDAARPERRDVDLAADPLVAQALAGIPVAGIEPYRDGFLLKAMAPIFHDENQLIGTIAVGMTLDNDFALMIRTLSGADIAIAERDGLVIAASRPELATGVAATTTSSGVLRLHGTEYQMMALPFVDVRQRPLGQVVILAQDPLPAILRRVTVTVTAILLGIAAVSVTVTALVLRRVLAPVAALRQGAERIGSGRFDHRLPVTGNDEIGELAGAFNAMAANLQRMRDVEEKLKHAERLASIGEFTAATAHELNNPIANIIGLARVIRKEVTEGTPLAEDLDLLVKETGRCGAIVRDLLLYSRASKPVRRQTDINGLIEEAIRSVSPRYCADRDIRVDFIPAVSERKLLAVDPVQIGQVLRNLLINAAQAIAGAGTIQITATPAGRDLAIAIADSGNGIRPEDLDRIFYPFFTTKKAGEGTGLGLAVCYTIVQAHGGAITVVNRPQGGAVATVTLPAGEEDA